MSSVSMYNVRETKQDQLEDIRGDPSAPNKPMQSRDGDAEGHRIQYLIVNSIGAGAGVHGPVSSTDSKLWCTN